MKEPRDYRLTPENRRLEREELAFQRQTNGRRRLSWAKALRTVNPRKTYQTSDGNVQEVLTGSKLLEKLHHLVTTRRCTFVEAITEVPGR